MILGMDFKSRSTSILVADDDEDDREFIRKAWEKSHDAHELRFVVDGQELTDYLNHSGKYCEPVSAPRPSLIRSEHAQKGRTRGASRH